MKRSSFTPALLAILVVPVCADLGGVRSLGPALHTGRLSALVRARRYWPAGTVVYLDDTRLTLEGIVADVADVHSAIIARLSTIHDTCVEDSSKVTATIAEHEDKVGQLEHDRLLSLAAQAEKQAELDSLAAKEAEAQASYDSTVAQRADQAVAFSKESATVAQQKDVLSQVLEKLREKRATLLANSSSAGSELDYIIGVFSGMVDASSADLTEGSSGHAKSDAELLNLVSSQKTSLDHINQQYQAENADKLAAEGAAANAAREKALRERMLEAHTDTRDHFWSFCGSGNGYGGSVHSAQTVVTESFNKFQSQSLQTLEIMDEIVKIESTTTTTLTTTSSTSTTITTTTTTITTTTTTTITAAPVLLEVSPLMRVAAAARAAPAAVASLRAGAATPRRGLAARRTGGGAAAALAVLRRATSARPGLLQALAAVLPDRSFLDLSRGVAGLQTSNTTVLSNETVQKCVDDKKDLTAQIVAVRKLARGGRSKVALLDSELSEVTTWTALLEAEGHKAEDVNAHFNQAWEDFKEEESKQVHTKALEGEVADLAAVSQNVSNYAGIQTVKGSVLPSLMSGLEQKLQSFHDNVKLSMQNLLADYEVAKKHLHEDRLKVLTDLVTMKGKESGLEANLTSAKDFVTEQEQQEQALQTELAAVEEQCEQELR